MEFMVINRQMAQEGAYKKLLKEFVMVSMYSPELGEAILPVYTQLSAILRIKCHDVDYSKTGEITAQRGFEDYDEITKFDEKMASDIINFVSEHAPKNVVVHCDAGLSRSPAVAMALSEIFNYGASSPQFFVRSYAGGMHLYNKHIYRTILEVGEKLMKGDLS